ncbi:MAG TPA: rhamnulokinase family protein [Bacillota bacterium]|nr:rhamnulokinase family protein [Bacillota bacterium]
MATRNIIGLDCGNSSFRILLGKYDGQTITTEVVDQLPNDMIRIGDYFYWDILKIFDGFQSSLKKIARKVDKIDSIGICTWGVDFAMFDQEGNMVGNPLSYRNEIGETYLSRLTEEQKREMFRKTGIACDKINSIYRLAALKEIMPSQYSIADKVLMVPDILNYFVTGVMVNEPSELSTTQIMSAKSRRICPEICEEFGISEDLFCKLGRHGERIGLVRKSILEEIGVDYDIPVICVPSHDTAAAVVAIPTQESDYIFISSGTWSLIGTETDEPVMDDAVLEVGLTNEVGAFDKITLLKNSAGMFIIQRIKKEYDLAADRNSTWEELKALAQERKGKIPLININNSRFFNPLKMSEEIWAYLVETGQVQGEFDWGTIIKAVYESMACCYAVTVEQLEAAVSKRFNSIYIVGGGSKNEVVNSLTAKRTGKKVLACGQESTSLGNIATQLKAFDETMDLKKIRKVIEDSIHIVEYSEPKEGAEVIARYKNMP